MNPVEVGQTLYTLYDWSSRMGENDVRAVMAETIEVVEGVYARVYHGTAVARSSLIYWYASPEAAASAVIATLRDDASRLNHRADVLAEKYLGGEA